MKRVIYTLFFAFVILAGKAAFSQAGVLDPTDPDRVFNSQNQPPAPPSNQISKWGHTNRLNWNPYSYGYKSYIFRGMAFRLKFPKTFDPNAVDGKKYPCFVFLHGLGEWANIYDNELQLVHGGQLHAQKVNSGEFDGILVYPQSSSGWLAGYDGIILDLLDSLTKYVKMDPDRVIIGGLSSGGQVAWDYLTKHPERWAVATIISAKNTSYNDLNWIPPILSIPVWVANGGQDKAPTPGLIDDIVNKYNELGGDIRHSFFPTQGHGVWDSYWAQPGYFQYLNDANKTQPLVKFKHNEFCPSDPVDAEMILQPGFFAYEWQKDNITIAGATSAAYTATEYGTYRARYKRTSTSEWSDWSPRPIVVSQKDATITPPIMVDGLHSKVLPAPDGSTSVPLKVPEGYASYDWRRISDNALVSTTNTYSASVGQYKVKVTEQFGCSSSYSEPFSVINATGNNVPDKATGLTAVTLSNSSIEVYWNNNPAPQYNETAFEIYRSVQQGGNYVIAGIVPSDTLQFIDHGLTPNVKYYYIVRAVNDNGASELSNEATAITLSDNTPPSTPQNLTVLGTSRHSITIGWQESTDDVGIKYYEIYLNGEKAYTTSLTSFKVNNLDSFTNYSFYVKAVDLSGNVSVSSNQVVGFTKFSGLDFNVYQGSWSKFPDFSTLTPVFSGNSPNVDISVSPFTENYGMVWEGWIYLPYSIQYTFYIRSDDGSALYIDQWYSPSATPLISMNKTQGATTASKSITLSAGMHKIALIYFQGGGAQEMGLYWSFNKTGFTSQIKIADSYLQDNVSPTGTAPAMPSNLLATASAYNKVNLSWNDNSTDETGFELYRKGPDDNDFSKIALVPSNSTSYADTLVEGNKKYAYAIQSVNSNGSSGFNPDDLSGVTYNYYEGTWDKLPDFNSLQPVTSGVIDNFSLDPKLKNDYFAFKYAATINVPTSGTYTFYTKSDDGSKLYIDNFTAAGLVVNNDYLQGPTERSGTINLTAGTHKIYVTFFEKNGGEFLEVRWQGPGINKQLIPDLALENVRTVVTTPAPPAIPDVPSNVNLTVLSKNSLELTFSDNSTQTGFEIQRSIGHDDNFRLFKILNTEDNSVTVIDSSLYPNNVVYYRVRAFGVSGYSDFSEIVSAKTLNTLPVITQLGNRAVYYAGTSLIPISAVDEDGDNLSFTFENLPAFATFSPTTKGQGNLVFTTKTSDAGLYQIKVRVDDNNGGLDSTMLSLSVTSNRPPTLGRLQSVVMNEGTSTVRSISAIDPDRHNTVKFQIKGAPSFVSVRQSPAGFSIFLTPGFADAGEYQFWVVATDGFGGFDSAAMNVSVLDVKPPTQKVYINILNNGSTPVPSAPWNNITGYSTPVLLDNNGQTTNMGITFNPTNWNTSNAGGGTNNNSGIYPDAVIRDNYFFGKYGIPDTMYFTLSGLNANSKYNLSLFSASTFTSGSTVFKVNSEVRTLDAYNNTKNIALFKQTLSDNLGDLIVKMYKAPGTEIGYLNAIVLEKPYDDGTVPAAPADFLAAPLPNGNILLKWKDVAYNEYGYLILRSESADGSYTKLNEGQINSDDSTFVDSTCLGNKQYYYKILAFNDNGNSDSVGIASVFSNNRIPKLSNLNDLFVKAGNSGILNVVATDDPGEVLSIQAIGLPSFATFENTGNGTAKITVNPSSGDEGFYKDITIKVSDQFGASVNKKFSVTVSDDQMRSVFINFGPSNASPEPAPWNNYLSYPSGGYTISNLTDDMNANTGFSFKFTTQLNSTLLLGMQDANEGIFPDNVLKSAVLITDNANYNMQFGGLDPSKKYNIAFMSSYNTGAEDSGSFSSGGQTVYLNGAYNTNKTVQLNGLAPAQNGTIDVQFNKTAATVYFLINAIVIQEYSGTPTIKPGNLFATPTLSTKAIQLIWSDRSDSETGYEVWRSTSLNGSYTLVTTTVANTTGYLDNSSSLVPGTNYYYKIRTKKGGSYSEYSNVARFGLAKNFVELNLNAEVVNHEALPWNNTDDGPSAEGTTVSDMVNTDFVNTGIDFVITKTFNGKGYAGMGTPGILPYNVMFTNYWTDAGQVSQAKFTNLDQRKTYRIGIFNSVNLSSNYYNGIYTINGIAKSINGRLNDFKMIYIDNVKPDENGEVFINVTPDPASPYTFTSAFTIEGYDTPAEEDTQGSQFVARKGTKGETATLISRTSVGSSATVELPKVLKLSAFPNPFVSQLNAEIEIPANMKQITLSLYDIDSRLIWKQEIHNTAGKQMIKIPVGQNLAPGSYLLKVSSTGESETIKLVKGK